MKMTDAEKLEAFLFAEHLLCRRYTDGETIRALKKTYKVSHSRATAIVSDIYETWIEEAKTERIDRKERTLHVLGELTRMAIKQGNVNDAVKVERLRADIEGTLAPEPTGPEAGEFGELDDFENRTDEELEYCQRTGMWPDESGTVH